MGFFDRFPYSNFHQLNLDWIIDKMKEVVADFNELESDVDTKIKGFQKQLKDFGEDIDTAVENEVQKLGDEGFFDDIISRLFTNMDYLNTLKNQKILIFGDSISDNSYQSYNKWTYYLSELAKNIQGCSVKNTAKAGNTIADVLTAINTETGFSPTTVIIFAGVNDYIKRTPLGVAYSTTTGQFNATLVSIYKAVTTKYPNAKVYWVSPMKTHRTFDTSKSEPYVPMPLYLGCISEKCKRFGWEFIDAYNNAPLINTEEGKVWYTSTDGSNYLHPSVKYSPILCQFILGCLVSGHGIPLSEVTEEVGLSVLSQMGMFANTNKTYFTIASGSESYCRAVVGTNSMSLRIIYSISASADSSYITLADFPDCLKPMMNKYIGQASITPSGASAFTTVNVVCVNTGKIFGQGNNKVAVNNVSFNVDFDKMLCVDDTTRIR